MNRIAFIFLAALVSCSKTSEPPATSAKISLERGSQGEILIELSASSKNVGAAQFELEIESTAAFSFEDAEAGGGLAFDTTRMNMRGTNRAILFVGDKRGLLLPAEGTIAQFRVRPQSASGDAILAIKSASLFDPEGEPIPVTIGGRIVIR